MQIESGQWGNSIGIRIPSFLTKKYGIEAGTKFEIDSLVDGFVLKPILKTKGKYTLNELLSKVTEDNIHPEHAEYDSLMSHPFVGSADDSVPVENVMKKLRKGRYSDI